MVALPPALPPLISVRVTGTAAAIRTTVATATTDGCCTTASVLDSAALALPIVSRTITPLWLVPATAAAAAAAA
jgi:hypothetical protein